MEPSMEIDVTAEEIVFGVRDCDRLIVLKPDGTIFVKNKLVANDVEVYVALKEFVQKGLNYVV